MGDYGPSIQSQAEQAPPHPSVDPVASDEISVLVTGFGPFKTNLVNASYLIASSLPSSINLPAPKTDGSSTTTSRRISIHVHPSPIPVAYSTVRSTVPALLDDYARAHAGRRPDLVMHMGIASTRSYYSVETQAHRDSYHIADIKGRSGYEDGEKPWRDLGLPPLIKPGPKASSSSGEAQQSSIASAYPPDAHFLETWKAFVPLGADVRISEDAGRYLCEFIFYTSLAQAWREGRDRNVIFFHVPASCEDADVELGVKVAVGLIKTLVTCWVDEKKA